jgi:hypothetical protein
MPSWADASNHGGMVKVSAAAVFRLISQARPFDHAFILLWTFGDWRDRVSLGKSPLLGHRMRDAFSGPALIFEECNPSHPAVNN